MTIPKCKYDDDLIAKSSPELTLRSGRQVVAVSTDVEVVGDLLIAP